MVYPEEDAPSGTLAHVGSLAYIIFCNDPRNLATRLQEKADKKWLARPAFPETDGLRLWEDLHVR